MVFVGCVWYELYLQLSFYLKFDLHNEKSVSNKFVFHIINLILEVNLMKETKR